MTVKASAQQTIIDITDAYGVYLTCASYTFPGSTSAAKAGSCTTQVIAMRGSEQVSAVVDASACTCPTGVSVASDGDATAPTLTVSVTTSVKTPGKVTIPVTVDGEAEFTLEFSFGVALTGETGTSVTVKSQAVTYQEGTSGTTAPTGTWSSSVPAVAQGSYLWTKTVVTYSDGKSTTAYSVSYNGVSVSVSSQAVTYQASTSGTTAPTGTWSSSIPTVAQGSYLWTKTVVTYSDGKSTTSYSVARQGANGSDGADAIAMTITSSKGTIFKNASISTTLTAHVYKGGAEVTGSALAALGTVKWYKDGSTTAAGTGTTLDVSASSVNTKMNIVAQLEG